MDGDRYFLAEPYYPLGRGEMKSIHTTVSVGGPFFDDANPAEINRIAAEIAKSPDMRRALGFTSQGHVERVLTKAVKAAASQVDGPNYFNITITGQDGKSIVYVNDQPLQEKEEINVEQEPKFKGFFEYKFDKLGEGDEHLKAAIGVIHDGDEVWVSDMVEPEAGRRVDEKAAFYVLVHNPVARPEYGLTRGTTRMFRVCQRGASVTGRDRLAVWPWLKPVFNRGKIQGFKPVL